MTRKPMLNIAVSTIILGAVLVSCSGMPNSRPTSIAQDAQDSLRKGNTEKALQKAEAAVEVDPRNAELRRVLGEAYLANGRFQSAEQSFADAVSLGDTSARTIISTALLDVAQGRDAAARDLLREHRNSLPAGDYGLAIALAGDTKQGVEVLTDIIRSGENTAKVRQNLGYAYALDGRWREAQIMVGQDLDPAATQARITEWAKLAHPDARETRVAALLGVTPVMDSGLPMRLALVQPEAPVVQVAAAEQATDMEQPAEATNVELAVIEPSETADNAQRAIAFAGAETAPLLMADSTPIKTQPDNAGNAVAIRFVSGEIVQPLPANYGKKPVQLASAQSHIAPAMFEKALAAGNGSTMKGSDSFKPSASGRYAVQLGIFSSAGNADRAWNFYTTKFSELSAFSRNTGSLFAQGRTLHRLTAGNFADVSTARAMCAKVVRGGGECIIRLVEPEQTASTRKTGSARTRASR